jgi:hypothetical protein
MIMNEISQSKPEIAGVITMGRISLPKYYLQENRPNCHIDFWKRTSSFDKNIPGAL